jgi:hypothetical protein
MMKVYWRWARVWLAELRRRLTERVTLGLLDRMGDAPGLDAAQRSWLLKDLREDLDDQIEDAEERGIAERDARELIATRAMVEWLEAGDFPPAAGIEFLEKEVARTPRHPGRQERRRRDAYLAAIGELGGDEEAAAKRWRDGIDESTRELLDFQGRKLRGRMEDLGLTIGVHVERTGIDTVRLVAVGQGEMGVDRMDRALGSVGSVARLDVRGHPLRPPSRPGGAGLLRDRTRGRRGGRRRPPVGRPGR